MTPAAARATMAERQHATPPVWRGRSRVRLLLDVVGGVRQNLDKLVQVLGLLAAFLWPPLVLRRVRRLHEMGHVGARPRFAQLLVAARDQMFLSASEETRIFYAQQGIPWFFHNLRRFIAGPATMLDPMGLFSPKGAIVHHVLQTFHRHPIYDVVLLYAYAGGPEEMLAQAEQIRDGIHPHQRALTSLIEDGSYHARLPDDVRAILADPYQPARPIPAGLLADPHLMLGMDQFKDIRGFFAYAARLRVSMLDAVFAWLTVAWNEILGRRLGLRLGPAAPDPGACDPELRARHFGPAVGATATAPAIGAA